MVFKTSIGDLEEGEYKVFNYLNAMFDAFMATDALPAEAGEYVLTCTATEGDDDVMEYAFSWESTSE